jgi:hypothetical protein
MRGSLAGISLGLRTSRFRNLKLATRNYGAESAEWRGSREFTLHDQIGSP